jgi:hypothetical protein
LWWGFYWVHRQLWSCRRPQQNAAVPALPALRLWGLSGETAAAPTRCRCRLRPFLVG